MGVPQRECLYFITDGKNKSAREVGGAGGPVQMLGGDPVPIQTPGGWRDFEVGFATDSEYNTLLRGATIPTLFVGSGERILRHYMLNGAGFNSELYLLVLRKDPATGIMKTEYYGKMDVLHAKDSIVGRGVICNCVQSGPMVYISANESKAYEIDCTAANPATKKVLFDGMSFREKYHYVYGTPTGSDFDINGDFVNTVPFVFSSNEGYSFDTVRADSIIADSLSIDDIDTYMNTVVNYYMYRPYATDVTIGGKLRWARYNSEPLHVDIYVRTNLGNQYPIAAGVLLPFSGILDIPIPTTVIPLAPNEKPFLFAQRSEGGSGNFIIQIFEGTEITWEFISKKQPTVHLGLEPLYVWQQLVKVMSGGKCTGDSTYLRANPQITLFPGQSLRNLEKAVLKTNYKDLFTHRDCLRPMGVKLDGNTVWLEPMEEMYGDGAEIFDFGELSKVSLQFAFDVLVNSTKFGHAHPGSQTPVQNSTTISNTNGVPEFNGINTGELPVTILKKEYTKVDPYIAAASEIEKLRTAYTPINANTANNTDNQVYVANVSNVQDTDGNYLLYRKAYTSITGVVADDVYNIEELTPGRMLRAHGVLLNPMIEQQGGAPITFLDTDLSADLVTVADGVTIAERAPVYPGEMAPGIMHMLDLYFTAPATIPYNSLLVKMNKGVAKGQVVGQDIYFLPIGELKSKPFTGEPQEMKLRISQRTSLAALFSLSLQGTFEIDELGNFIWISIFNPLHFHKYAFTPGAGFHNLGIYDAAFQHRNDRYGSQPIYEDPIQTVDPCPLQFVTSGFGVITIKTYAFEDLVTGAREIMRLPDNQRRAAYTALLLATEPKQTNACAPRVQAGVNLPYVLQQGEVDWSVLEEGRYINYLFVEGTEEPIREGEWVDLREDHPDTYAFDYWNTLNKDNVYWNEDFRPRVRCEATGLPIYGKADSEQYIDEIRNNTPQDGRFYDVSTLILGEANGIPDWKQRKLNAILILNRCKIENVLWSRNENAQLEPTVREGYPMNWYSVEVSPQKQSMGDTYTAEPGETSDTNIYSCDFSAMGFGDDVYDIDVEEDP